jgi:hypothetical protein
MFHMNSQDERRQVRPMVAMFTNPSAGFESLRDRPVFFGAVLLVSVLAVALSALIIEAVGFENIVANQIRNSPQLASMPAEEKAQLIASQSSVVWKYFSIFAGALGVLAVMFLGGLYYWFAMNALGSKVRYPHGVAVWAYSTVPTMVLVFVANVVVVAFKPVEEISLNMQSSTGLVQANLGMLLDSSASPALIALLSGLDMFSFIGWVLAFVGIKVVGRLSASSALGIVVLSALAGITVMVAAATLFG